jgi:heme-degrading monooxygenase HmoA
MFVRFVRLRVREGQEQAFAGWYRSRVIPELSALSACAFAGLLAPWRSEDHLSFTIWRHAGGANAYERSGLYHQLLREAEPMLSPRTEWTVRPGGGEADERTDAKIREIPSEGFVLEAGESEARRLGKDLDSAFVRIVSVRVAPDRIGEFVAAYSERILPTLREQPGFRGGLLAEDGSIYGAFLSITLWGREEDATRYEMSGAFAQLTDEVKDTFSPLYTWPASLAGARDRDPRLDAPKVASYQLVMGKRLGYDGR